MRNLKVSSPVGNVFHPTFFRWRRPTAQPAIGASTLRASTGMPACSAPAADEPSARVRKLRQALQRHPEFRPPALFGGNPWSRSAGAPRRPRRSTDRRPAGYRGRGKWPLWRRHGTARLRSLGRIEQLANSGKHRRDICWHSGLCKRRILRRFSLYLRIQKPTPNPWAPMLG